MTRQDLIDNGHGDIVIFDNPDFDGCIIGITTDNRAVYSLAQMVTWLCDKGGGEGLEFETASEALEFIKYNTLRALFYVDNAPVVLDDL